MADLSAFSSESFNTASWINSAIKEHNEDESLESYLASLAMKLHIISQDYTDQLESGMVETMLKIPRMLSEISQIEDVLHNIEETMANLNEQIATFDQRNIHGIDDLTRLDNLKTNMENCKSTLEEHARWSQLVRETKVLIEDGHNLSDAADRVETMLRSLDILKHLSGHEERAEVCGVFRDSLIDALKPKVQRDIIGYDLAPLYESLYVYDKLGRRRELEEVYVLVRPEELGATWLAALDSLVESELTSRFCSTVNEFLNEVTTFIIDESSRIKALFGNERSPSLLCAILVRLMSVVTPALRNKLQLIDNPVPTIEVYNIMEKFTHRIFAYVDGVTCSTWASSVQALMESLLQLQDEYVNQETTYVRNALNINMQHITFSPPKTEFEGGGLDMSLPDDPTTEFVAFADRLLTAADSYQCSLESSVGRTATLLGGLRVKPVLRSLAGLLAGLMKQVLNKIEELRAASGLVADPTTLSTVSEGGGDGSAAGVTPTTVTISDVDSAWRRMVQGGGITARLLVPSALQTMQATGRFCRRMGEVEVFTSEQLTQLLAALFPDDRDKESLDQWHRGGGNAGVLLASHILSADIAAASELRGFLAASARTVGTSAQSVYAAVIPGLTKLKLASSSFLFDLCAAGPRAVLGGLSNDELYAGPVLGSGTYNPSEHRFHAYLDSLLPQPTVTQVGEHLLSLVQELETFATSGALEDLMQLTGEAVPLSLRGWKGLKPVLDLNAWDEESIESLCRRSSSRVAVLGVEKVIFGSDASNVEGWIDSDYSENADDTAPQDAALRFVNEWLGSICDFTVGLFVAVVVRVVMLSPLGLAQLLVDVDYLCNVVNAIGLTPHPVLSHFSKLLRYDPVRITSTQQTGCLTGRSNTLLSLIDMKILSAIAAGHGMVDKKTEN